MCSVHMIYDKFKNVHVYKLLNNLYFCLLTSGSIYHKFYRGCNAPKQKHILIIFDWHLSKMGSLYNNQFLTHLCNILSKYELNGKFLLGKIYLYRLRNGFRNNYKVRVCL